MKFKLDENFGTRTLSIFQAAGYDVSTVSIQGMQGCRDEFLYKVCSEEDRCLVTFDMDFADVVRFSPSNASGIVVIRMPQNPSLYLLEGLIQQFLMNISTMPLKQRLWIVEPGRIRMHEPDGKTDEDQQ